MILAIMIKQIELYNSVGKYLPPFNKNGLQKIPFSKWSDQNFCICILIFNMFAAQFAKKKKKKKKKKKSYCKKKKKKNLIVRKIFHLH